MADKSISQKAVEQLAILGTEESGTLSPLLKTPHSKNITLSDWNEFLHVSDRNLADVKRVYEVLKTTLPALESYIANEADELTTSFNNLVSDVADRMEWKGTLEKIESLGSLKVREGDVYTIAQPVSTKPDESFETGKESAWLYVGKSIPNTYDGWVCLSGLIDFDKIRGYASDAETNAKAYTDACAAELNGLGISEFAIVPKQTPEGAPIFGTYVFKITLNNGDVFAKELDLPLEAVQIASVDDKFIDDERCLVITFVDENVTPIVVKFDEILNYDALIKNEIHIGSKAPTGDEVLWIDTSSKGSPFEPYDDYAALYPTASGFKYVRLTMDGWNTGAFQKEIACDLTCTFMGQSPVTYTLTGNVREALGLYTVKESTSSLYPTRRAVVGSTVYIYFDINSGTIDPLEVYVKGRISRCSGLTLEHVSGIPSGATYINHLSPLSEAYVTYYDSEVRKTRPIGTYTAANGIVCRNATAGLELRSLKSGESYADNEAVPLSYIRDTMLSNAGGSGGGGNANIDVTAEVGQTIIVKEVDENGKPTKWESADYQPRIAWTDETVVLPETTVEAVEDGDGAYVAMLPEFTLVGGSKYVITYNGTEYVSECVAIELDGTKLFLLGNSPLIMETGDNGIPLAIGITIDGEDSYYSLIPLDGATTVTVSITQEDVTPIPAQYVTNAFPLYIDATAENNPNGGINYPINYTFTTPADEVKKAFDSGREIKLRLKLPETRSAVIYNLATGALFSEAGDMMYVFTLPYSDYGSADAVVNLFVGYVRPVLQIVGQNGGALLLYSD